MVMTLEEIKALAAKAEELDDQSVSTEFTGKAPPPEGKAMARLVEYIELGMHKQKPFKGKEKPDAAEVRLTFDLLGPKYIREITVDGKPKKICDTITVRIKLSKNEKAKYKKLFEQMRYGRTDIKHVARMLGEAFQLTIKHNTVGEGDAAKVYANVELIEAPRMYNPITGDVVDLPVPMPMSDLKIFIFDNPTLASWDSLFIPGESTFKNADGVEQTRSKNYIQEIIMSASNFKGSAVEAMLNGANKLEEKTTPATKAEPVKKAPVAESDALSELGLNDEVTF